MSAQDSEALEHVLRIESRLGTTLPEEYRDFLLAGLPWDEDRCILEWGGGGEYPYVVQLDEPHHYKIVREEVFRGGIVRNLTIEFMLDIFEERTPGMGIIPDEAMSVWGVDTDEEVLLFIRGPRRGQVWIKNWHRLEEEGIDEPEDGLHFVANNFREFLDMLQVDDGSWDEDA